VPLPGLPAPLQGAQQRAPSVTLISDERCDQAVPRTQFCSLSPFLIGERAGVCGRRPTRTGLPLTPTTESAAHRRASIFIGTPVRPPTAEIGETL